MAPVVIILIFANIFSLNSLPGLEILRGMGSTLRTLAKMYRDLGSPHIDQGMLKLRRSDGSV